MDYIKTLLFNNLFMDMQEHIKKPEDITLVSARELGERGAEAHATLGKMKVELRARALPKMASLLGVQLEKFEQYVHGPIQELLPAVVFDILRIPLENVIWRHVTPNDLKLLRSSPLVISAEFVHDTLRVRLDPTSLVAIPKSPAGPLADGIREAVDGVVHPPG